MPDQVEQLKHEVQELQERVERIIQQVQGDSQGNLIREAKITALCTLLEEVCERLGLKKGEFWPIFEKRALWWQNRFLSCVDKTDEEAIDLLTGKILGNPDVVEPYVPLFQPSKGEGMG